MTTVRRFATSSVLVLVTSLGLTAYAGPSAVATSKPPPTDPGRHQTHPRSKIAAPDHRRNPGLKAILSEKDADRGAEDPTQSSVTATINMDSIDTRQEQRDAHIKSADFFDTGNHTVAQQNQKCRTNEFGEEGLHLRGIDD